MEEIKCPAGHEAVTMHVLKDVEFRLVTYWNEAHFSVVSKVDLKSSGDAGKGRSLKEARDEFANLYGPLATLKRNATKNAGIRGRDALHLSRAFNKALRDKQKQ